MEACRDLLLRDLDACTDASFHAELANELKALIRADYFNAYTAADSTVGKSSLPKVELLTELVKVGALTLAMRVKSTSHYDALFAPPDGFIKSTATTLSTADAYPAWLLDDTTLCERVGSHPPTVRSLQSRPLDVDEDGDDSLSSSPPSSAELVFSLDDQATATSTQ